MHRENVLHVKVFVFFFKYNMVLLSSSMHNLDALLLVLSKALQFRFRLSKIIISQNQLLKLQETRCTEVIPIIFISKKTFTFLKPFLFFCFYNWWWMVWYCHNYHLHMRELLNCLDSWIYTIVFSTLIWIRKCRKSWNNFIIPQ